MPIPKYIRRPGYREVVPVKGTLYTIVDGDTLSKIAQIVYGKADAWPTIYKANVTNRLISGDPDLIYPDEVIWIPYSIGELFPPTISGKADSEMTIIVDGVEIPIISARVIRTMNSLSDAWTATIPWNPGEDLALDEATKPYQFQEAAAYLGGDLKVGGILYDIEVSASKDQGVLKNLSGYSFTADAIDSNIKPPYEANNITLKQRAEDLLYPMGIGVEFGNVEEGGKFDRVTATPEDTVFTHLSKLATQRGLLMTSDKQGNVLFIQANTEGKAIGTIEEAPDQFQGLGAEEYVASFSGRKRFKTYKVTSQSPGNKAAVAVSQDDYISRPRLKNLRVNDVIIGELQKVADWQRSKVLADALTIPFPVSTWYGPDGKLWAENTLLTVKSPTLFINEGFTFLIKQVEFIYESGGVRATLSLVPPQVYSGELLVEPWV